MKTLNDILKEHPEWGDLPIGVYVPDGTYDMIDGAGDVYVGADDEGDLLVFAAN